MKNIITIIFATFSFAVYAQETMHPSPAQNKAIIITNATVHVGNGIVKENTSVVFENGKIIFVGIATANSGFSGATVIDGTGKHVYPGIIAASTNLGLVEVGSVHATQDFSELGEVNPSISSLEAYNTDSKVINTLRTNGVLLAHIVPQGGSISGTSSVVQLDAWNWEDAAYKAYNGIHYNMPSLVNRADPFAAFRRRGGASVDVDIIKQGIERIESSRVFFREAKAYLSDATHKQTNLKYEAVKGLYNQTQTFFVHCNGVKEMIMAIDFAKEFGFKLCIVGGNESWMIADVLKSNNTSVILNEPHSLPDTEDDAVDQPYKTGAALQKAGVTFTISIPDFWQQRCLPFQAGTMAAYGLTKEEALTAITLNAAEILGIDNTTGSIEKGKDANILISSGDILDMKTSNVTNAFIQGRQIDLNNKQTDLYKRYKYKYEID